MHIGVRIDWKIVRFASNGIYLSFNTGYKEHTHLLYLFILSVISLLFLSPSFVKIHPRCFTTASLTCSPTRTISFTSSFCFFTVTISVLATFMVTPASSKHSFQHSNDLFRWGLLLLQHAMSSAYIPLLVISKPFLKSLYYHVYISNKQHW